MKQTSWPIIVNESFTNESTHKHKTYKSINIMGHEVPNASPGTLTSIHRDLPMWLRSPLTVTTSFTKRIWREMDFEVDRVNHYSGFGDYVAIAMIANQLEGVGINIYRNKFLQYDCMPEPAFFKKNYGMAEPFTPLYFLETERKYRGNWDRILYVPYMQNRILFMPAGTFHGINLEDFEPSLPSEALYLEYVFFEGKFNEEFYLFSKANSREDGRRD